MIRARSVILGAAVATMGTTAACAAAASGVGTFVYVANQSGASVSIVDAEAPAVVGRVDLEALGFGANPKPHDTAVEPDGSHWYVTLIGANRVLRFDRGNNLVGQVEMEVPGLIVAHPTEDLLLVGRSMTAVDPPSSVALIRASDMTLVDEIDVVFPRPHALAIGRQGGWVYTASLAENRIAAIDLESGRVNLIEVPEASPDIIPGPADGDSVHPADHMSAGGAHTLVEFALSPDGRTMVAGGEVSGDLIVFDLSDPAAPRVVETIPLGGAPWHSAFTPDGRYVYVPLHRADAVAVVDAATWEVVARITGQGFAQPHGAAPSPDGRWMFVSNNNTGGIDAVPGARGTVVVIDAATRETAEVLEVGPQAAGIETVPPRR